MSAMKKMVNIETRSDGWVMGSEVAPDKVLWWRSDGPRWCVSHVTDGVAMDGFTFTTEALALDWVEEIAAKRPSAKMTTVLDLMTMRPSTRSDAYGFEPASKIAASAGLMSLAGRIAKAELEGASVLDELMSTYCYCADWSSALLMMGMNEGFVTFHVGVVKERARQERLHPRGLMNPMAVLMEEIGEVCDAIIAGDYDNLKTELVQVAAVCMRWMEGLLP